MDVIKEWGEVHLATKTKRYQQYSREGHSYKSKQRLLKLAQQGLNFHTRRERKL
jgi:hypothetical protein